VLELTDSQTNPINPTLSTRPIPHRTTQLVQPISIDQRRDHQHRLPTSQCPSLLAADVKSSRRDFWRHEDSPQSRVPLRGTSLGCRRLRHEAQLSLLMTVKCMTRAPS